MSFSIRAFPPPKASEPELLQFPTYESWEYRLGSAERAASLEVRVYHDRDGNGLSDSDDAVVSELNDIFGSRKSCLEARSLL